MKTNAHRHLLCLSLALLFSAFTAAEETPRFAGWKQATTNHFRFIYEDAFRPQAEAFARTADDAWNRVSEAYGTPPAMTDVVVTGRTDTVNAYAEGLSYFIGLFTNPPLSPEFGYREDWAKLFLTHELIHIANFSFEGKTKPVADIFGPFFNFVNFTGIAPWAMEGLTTVLETELTDGGRGRSPFFEMYYKAAALENSFIRFDEIGQEKDPPRGQIYIMGYLLMKSIADRWGTAALADIERNRRFGTSFEESVKLVTGHTSEELFQDARIALAKKYASERSIPEGKTVTRRKPNTNYYRPALISQKAIITVRDIKGKDRAAVSFDPATGKETILFEGNFADELSLTASDDGKIIASLRSGRMDRMPGYTVTTGLYSWKKDGGLKKLTQGTSLFQPSLSRSGNRLVAVELSGITYRLVEVNPENGKRTVLLESATVSYIQPALSADGSQIAFLVADGTRAALATAPMPRHDFSYPIPPGNVSVQANGSGPVLDIAYPAWSVDGTLLYASNGRGRLEVWELAGGTAVPVVSDPVGAFWAERTDEGICYASYAGSGYVLKMKPADQWGVVPSFAGPSAPGEIITLGHLASDYPGFAPYPAPEKKDDGALTPIRRKEGIRTTDTQTVLGADKPFINYPRLLLTLPSFSYLGKNGGQPVAGAGGFALFSGYPLQSGARGNIAAVGGNWYPSIGQAGAFAFGAFPLYTGELSFYGQRSVGIEESTGSFAETSAGSLSYSFPLAKTSFFRDMLDAALVTGFEAVAERRDGSAFSAAADIPYASGFTGKAGIDLVYKKDVTDSFSMTVRGESKILVSVFPAFADKKFVSGELSALVSAGTKKMMGEAGMRSRWFDLPAGAPLPSTLVHIKGGRLDSSYPLRSILQAGIVIPNDVSSRFFVEKLVSFGSAALQSPLIDKDWHTGIELEMETGRTRIAFGLANRFRDPLAINIPENTRIYLTIKMDALRGGYP